MSNEVAKRGEQLPGSPAELLSGLKGMQVGMERDGSGRKGEFMKFVKGDYVYGIDQNGVDEESEWAVNPSSFVCGYQAWGNSRLLGEEVAGMNEPPVIKANLPIHSYLFTDPKTKEKEELDAEWAPLRGFQLVCVNGEDLGTQCFISGTSRGFRSAATELFNEVVAHMENVDISTPVPIIVLEGDSYKHKDPTIGTVQIPIFNVVDWADADATTVPEPDDDSDDDGCEADENDEGETPGEIVEAFPGNEEKPPKRGRRSRRAEAAAPADKAEAPKRARRGRQPAKAAEDPKPDAQTTTQRRTRRRRGSAS